MASIKDLKKRIVTVKNTQQTTRAMKMVSAAKLRRAQEAINNNRPFAQRMGALLNTVISLPDLSATSPLLARDSVEGEGKKLLLLLVTSDRGLCGGFNGNIIKQTQRWIKANSDGYAKVTLGFVGRRGYDFFKNRRSDLGPYYSELSGKVSFAKAKKLAAALMERYLAGEFDEIKVVYNEFKNAVTQTVLVENYLPLSQKAGAEQKSDVVPTLYIVRPSAEALFETLLSKYFSIHLFRILLDSQASEHGARMSAMENATKNAGDMIRKLTLQFNKQRQASITKELLEIISGSESQKS